MIVFVITIKQLSTNQRSQMYKNSYHTEQQHHMVYLPLDQFALPRISDLDNEDQISSGDDIGLYSDNCHYTPVYYDDVTESHEFSFESAPESSTNHSVTTVARHMQLVGDGSRSNEEDPCTVSK